MDDASAVGTNARADRPGAGTAADDARADARETAQCEVLVIGGGPGGATIAALLARRGRDVVLVDKDVHPRFHIGESLLPANLPLFRELGVLDKVRAIGMPKWGVELVSPAHAQTGKLEFSQAWDPELPMAFQVRRADLDLILLRHARECGARVFEGEKVRNVQFLPGFAGATAESRAVDGRVTQWEARFVIDATGRDTLLANQFKLKRRNPDHASTALYGHFADVERLAGREEGNITIVWFEHGWFWVIPLADGTTSIGAVTWPYYLKSRSKPLKEFLDDTIALAPVLKARMKNARLVSDVHATGNYSYLSDRNHGAPDQAAFLLCGDAYAFVDPVFSSGVFLAMQSAFLAQDAVCNILDAPENARQKTATAEMLKYQERFDHGPKQFSWFIYRMTSPAMRGLFIQPRNILRMREAVLSVLAGDLYRGMPFAHALRCFKILYYIAWLGQPRAAFAAWRRRRRNVREPQSAAG